MSQRIHFLVSNFTKNTDILRKWHKHFFGKTFLCQAKKNNFELKLLKLLENHVKTQLNSFFFFFQIFELGNIFENVDQ